MGAGGASTPSAVKHRPADVVPQRLVIQYEHPNHLRKLVTLPSTLESPCGLALSFRRGCTCCLDRIRGSAELMRGDVGDGRRLAGGVRGMPGCEAGPCATGQECAMRSRRPTASETGGSAAMPSATERAASR